jgi:hypothetical protein
MFNPTEHLINLKGKKYLQVAWRLVWFREEKPDWNIQTTLLYHDLEKGSATFVCEIFDDNKEQKSMGHGSETIGDFHDYLEKAETKAIGRALAILGYGTQFATELDEGERVVDSPAPTQIEIIEKPQREDIVSADELKRKVETLYLLGEMKGISRSRLKARVFAKYGKSPEALSVKELLFLAGLLT